jgi:hypothetical protein
MEKLKAIHGRCLAMSFKVFIKTLNDRIGDYALEDLGGNGPLLSDLGRPYRHRSPAVTDS